MLKRLYKQYSKNKKTTGMNKKISKKMIDSGYDRNVAAVQRRLYRLKDKGLI